MASRNNRKGSLAQGTPIASSLSPCRSVVKALTLRCSTLHHIINLILLFNPTHSRTTRRCTRCRLLPLRSCGRRITRVIERRRTLSLLRFPGLQICWSMRGLRCRVNGCYATANVDLAYNVYNVHTFELCCHLASYVLCNSGHCWMNVQLANV